ncbi:448_t:CDS:1, partial [Ambispora gerdemannii]
EYIKKRVLPFALLSVTSISSKNGETGTFSRHRIIFIDETALDLSRIRLVDGTKTAKSHSAITKIVSEGEASREREKRLFYSTNIMDAPFYESIFDPKHMSNVARNSLPKIEFMLLIGHPTIQTSTPSKACGRLGMPLLLTEE